MNRLIFTIFSLLLLVFSSCAPGTLLKLSDNQNVVFLDSIAASSAILDDDTEGFFEKINLLDMCIQMKRKLGSFAHPADVLFDYKIFLQKDVATFSDSEKQLLKGVMKKAHVYCNRLSPKIFPQEIQLIKTHAQHYGGGVYYTRENRVVIPADALITKGRKKAEVEEALFRTMLHEIFHIYSRYHEQERRALYGLIGFKNFYNIPIEMNDALRKRILINPDGIDIVQVIELNRDSGLISAIPIITASETDYTTTKPGFFNYLQFDLYQVIRKGKGLHVISDANGRSTLNLQELPDFFKKIKDNTQYIIHPDEIMADNFMFLVLDENGAFSKSSFSKEGQQLLEDIKKVLKGE